MFWKCYEMICIDLKLDFCQNFCLPNGNSYSPDKTNNNVVFIAQMELILMNILTSYHTYSNIIFITYSRAICIFTISWKIIKHWTMNIQKFENWCSIFFVWIIEIPIWLRFMYLYRTQSEPFVLMTECDIATQ